MSDKAISFVVPGEPVAKGRAKFARRGNFVTAYTPEKTARYEDRVMMCAREAMGFTAFQDGDPPIQGPLELRVTAIRSIPSSLSGKKQRAAELGEIMPTTKPDLDNVVKAIKDACNKIVWRDDSQVVDLIAKKRYGRIPRVEIEVRRAG